MIHAKSAVETHVSLDLTPLIDIVFIVIVFLLLAVNTRLLSLPVEIPSSKNPAEVATTSTHDLIITLQADAPFWALNDQKFNNWDTFEPALLAALTTEVAYQQIYIAPAHNANVEPLVQLLSILNEKQVPNTRILMKKQGS